MLNTENTKPGNWRPTWTRLLQILTMRFFIVFLGFPWTFRKDF